MTDRIYFDMELVEELSALADRVKEIDAISISTKVGQKLTTFVISREDSEQNGKKELLEANFVALGKGG